MRSRRFGTCLSGYPGGKPEFHRAGIVGGPSFQAARVIETVDPEVPS
jgi:hypothetical protein